MDTRQRKIDPEPISIFMAVMATYAASVASLNYVKSHYRPLPSKVRHRVLGDVNKISTLIHEMRLDLTTVKRIFESGDFPRERTIRLGNGAFLSYDDFLLYQRVSANIFRTLSKAHSFCLRLERDALSHDSLDMDRPTNELGAAYEVFESLQHTRDLSVEAAWDRLDELAELIQRACDSVRSQLQ